MGSYIAKMICICSFLVANIACKTLDESKRQPQFTQSLGSSSYEGSVANISVDSKSLAAIKISLSRTGFEKAFAKMKDLNETHTSDALDNSDSRQKLDHFSRVFLVEYAQVLSSMDIAVRRLMIQSLRLQKHLTLKNMEATIVSNVSLVDPRAHLTEEVTAGLAYFNHWAQQTVGVEALPETGPENENVPNQKSGNQLLSLSGH